MIYEWFSSVATLEELSQGDLIPDCPILIPPELLEIGTLLEVEVTLIDCVILSQSCDLINGKIEIVLVSPYYSLKQFLEGLPSEQTSTDRAKRKILDNLKQGNIPGYHLLNKATGFLDDYQVVDFRNVYGININALRLIANKLDSRVRLLPPYREHLSQAFARYFMRVGLPQDFEIEGY